MNNPLITLLADLKTNSISFSDVLSFIEAHYQHVPTAFKNGEVYNESTQNQGSAKVFGFAQLHDLDQVTTLSLFAEHYHAVLAHPDAEDHQNIRQFMRCGWAGIQFVGTPLLLKQ